MLTSPGQHPQEVIIHLPREFTFKSQRDFRKTYEALDRSMEIVLDFGEVQYMDSSAFGMLLIFREHFGGDQARIRITHLTPAIRTLLDVAQFGEMFPY